MVSLHIETARFKSPGHKNELCFFRDTLMLIHAVWYEIDKHWDQDISNIPP